MIDPAILNLIRTAAIQRGATYHALHVDQARFSGIGRIRIWREVADKFDLLVHIHASVKPGKSWIQFQKVD